MNFVMSHIEKINSCWNWTDRLGPDGRPIVLWAISNQRYNTGRKKYKTYTVRQLTLKIVGRSINGRRIHSQCKNNLCINPDHLFSGNENRFWNKVHKLNETHGGCWIWLAGENPKGYGIFTLSEHGKKETIYAHRYSWQIKYGRKLPTVVLVCHKCDNPRCVNPDHMFIGNASDNIEDMCNKNRQSRGEQINTCKLSEEKVKQIRAAHTRGISVKDLSALYQVSTANIYCIIKKSTWKHID